MRSPTFDESDSRFDHSGEGHGVSGVHVQHAVVRRWSLSPDGADQNGRSETGVSTGDLPGMSGHDDGGLGRERAVRVLTRTFGNGHEWQRVVEWLCVPREPASFRTENDPGHGTKRDWPDAQSNETRSSERVRFRVRRFT